MKLKFVFHMWQSCIINPNGNHVCALLINQWYTNEYHLIVCVCFNYQWYTNIDVHTVCVCKKLARCTNFIAIDDNAITTKLMCTNIYKLNVCDKILIW